MPKLQESDLTPEVRKALGLPPARKVAFRKDDVRGFAIRCLAPLAGLTQNERRRVLEHALRINEQ